MRTKLKKLLFIAVLLFAAFTAQTSHALLQAVGPVNPADGFPLWYQDATGLSLGQCLDSNGFCVLPLAGEEAGFNPANPVAFPGNYPSESFYFIADALLGPALYVSGVEAAFSTGDPAPNAQITFARIRIRVDVPQTGAVVVTHPYGVLNQNVTAIVAGPEINSTADVGVADGIFTGALNGAVGPFLQSATVTNKNVVDPVTGKVYLSNPATTVAVTGSPNATNFFSVQGGGLSLTTDQFTLAGNVIGMSAAPQALTFAAQKVGALSAAQVVTVTNISTTSTLTLGQVITEGTNSNDFQIAAVPADTCSNQVIPANGTCTFGVEFTSAIAAPAARTANAVIPAANAADSPSARVALNGTIDSVPPTVITTFPDNGQTVPSNTTITAIFSEPMSGPTITGTTTFVVTGPSGTVSGSVLYDAVNNTATFIPTALVSETTYTATITTAATDIAGNGLAADKVWSFLTVPPDTTAPTVSFTSPEDAAIGVPVRSQIKITFSEQMHAASINATTVTVSGGVTAAAVTYDTASNTATFFPAAPLANGTAYTVTVKGGAGGVDDLAQNTLAADYVFSFVTNRNPSVPVLLTPISGATVQGTTVTLTWQKAVDDDGDALEYHIEVCNNAAFLGCGHDEVPAVASAPRLNGAYFAGLGGLGMAVMGLVSFGGLKGGKKYVALLIVVLLMSGAVMSACSGGGDDDPAPAPVDTTKMSFTKSGLSSGTLYYWRVEAHDGKGGDIITEPESFRTSL